MSKDNSKVHRKLRYIYGEQCMFEAAHVAKKIEAIGGIKTFKVFVEEKRYTGKKISYQLTVHHLQHRSNGGKTTVENCSLVAEVAHQYIHSLPFEHEDIINDMIREYKLNFAIMGGDGKIQEAQSLDICIDDMGDDCLVIPLENNTPEQNEWFIKQREEKKKREQYQKIKNPSRAAKKRELQELIKEEESFHEDR
jgi:copper chaperone CopZ